MFVSTTTFLVKEETVMVVATEKERGLGVEFQRLRRITGVRRVLNLKG